MLEHRQSLSDIGALGCSRGRTRSGCCATSGAASVACMGMSAEVAGACGMPAALLSIGVVVAELVGDTFVERDRDGEAASACSTMSSTTLAFAFAFAFSATFAFASTPTLTSCLANFLGLKALGVVVESGSTTDGVAILACAGDFEVCTPVCRCVTVGASSHGCGTARLMLVGVARTVDFLVMFHQGDVLSPLCIRSLMWVQRVNVSLLTSED